jgi:hypothetical protein
MHKAMSRLEDSNPRSPTPLAKAIFLGLAVVLPILAWEKRGAVIGILAVVVLGGLFFAAALERPLIAKSLATPRSRWSRRRVVLDAALVAPICFLTLAASTSLPLGGCAAGALLVGALVAVAVWRDRRRSSSPSTRATGGN